MAKRVEYKASVEKDLRRLAAGDALRVFQKIEQALGSESEKGAALSGEFAGLFRLRVGDHRVIYTRTDEGYLVLRIGHRGNVYARGRPPR